jgi:hypothetical protein
MKNKHSAVVFLIWFFSTIVIGLVFEIVFVGLIDPYGLYGIMNYPNINQVKPGISRYLYEIKLAHVKHLNSEALILGNSRAEIGFDPESPSLKKLNYSTYNLAIRGTNMMTSYRQLQYFEHIKLKPKLAILGLDFLDFLSASNSSESSASLLGNHNQIDPVETWFWRFDSLVSMLSVKDAFRTLLIQHDGEAETMTPYGFNPLKEYNSAARAEGYYKIFQQRAQENAIVFYKKSQWQIGEIELAVFRAILDSALQSGTEVILIIYPYHAQILAMFEDYGMWKKFSDWKLLLAQEVLKAKRLYPEAKVSLLDFSGYGAYNCEHIPEKGDRKSATQWYWEAGHFKKELGDRVLQRAISLAHESFQAADSKDDDSSFGVLLTEDHHEANEQRIAQERIQCAQQYPAVFLNTQNLIHATISQLSSINR